MPLLHDVISVEAMRDRQLQVRFDDGVHGVIDISGVVTMSGVFEPLREFAYFRQVHVHPELKVVRWPNGADLDSEVLYAKVSASRG